MKKNKVFVLIHGNNFEAECVKVELFDSRKKANAKARKLAEKLYRNDIIQDYDAISDIDIKKILKKTSMKKISKELWPYFWYEIKKQKIK